MLIKMVRSRDKMSLSDLAHSIGEYGRKSISVAGELLGGARSSGRRQPVSLVMVRVDCRLIHGQVVEAWLPFISADCVIVANDEASSDPLQKTIMEMAVPPQVETAVLGIDEAVPAFEVG